MSFKPLYDRVAIQVSEEEEKTVGGIIIPDTAKEKPSQGVVVATGEGVRADDGKLHPLKVKNGDKVVYGKWAGNEVKVDGKTLIILKESDIMGIII